MKDFEELFPLCKKHNRKLYDETLHHYLVMQGVSEKIGVPVEELIEFCYKCKLRLELIQNQEEVLKEYGSGEHNTVLRKVSKDNGRK